MKKLKITAIATLVLSIFVVMPSANAQFSDVGDRYKESVDYMVDMNYANGFTPTKFGTDQSIKRIDAAVIVARAMGFDRSSSFPSAGFTDVPADRAWAVNALKAKGVIDGKKPGQYGSNDFMTRAEMSKVIALAYQLNSTSTSIPFTDVSDRFRTYVAALLENGITQGKTATSFGSNQQITRGEFSLFIFRADLQVGAPEVISVE